MVTFILGLVVGASLGWMAGSKIHPIDKANRERAAAKQKHLDQIMQMLSEKSEIANDDVEKFLDVSDSTATRYLEELEQQGKLVQEGNRGKYVVYRPKT